MKNIIIGILFLVLLGCEDRGDTVKCIIPDDYKIGDSYQIVMDSSEGIDVPLIDGCYIYDYTGNGKFRTFDPFKNWQIHVVVTESGKIIQDVKGAVDKSVRIFLSSTGYSDGDEMIIEVINP